MSPRKEPHTWRTVMADLKLPETPAAIAHAGAQLRLRGAYGPAAEAYRETLRRDPANKSALRELASVYQTLGDSAEARRLISHLDGVLADESLLLAARRLAKGDTMEARQHLERCLEIAPDHDGGRYLMAALGDAPYPPQAPASLITTIYDQLAPRYDWLSSELLHRKTPEQMHSLVRKALQASDGGIAIVDLGCGTGLCAEPFTSTDGRIHGVDLSPAMLERAKRKGLYHSLAHAEYSGWLVEQRGKFDLVLAGEAFTHKGDLVDTFACVAASLRQGGLFACSIDHVEDAPYRLRENGQYGHNPFYVRQIATEHGLSLIDFRHAVLREEEGRAIRGEAIVFKRQ
jgi:predicted TPR repeat methyltransferase